MLKRLFGRGSTTNEPNIIQLAPLTDDASMALEEIVVPRNGKAALEIRFQSDKEYCTDLLESSFLSGLAKDIKQRNDFGTQRVSLLAHGLRVSNTVQPDIANMVNQCLDILHLNDKNVETYIYNDPQPNASCMYFDEEHIFVQLSSGLIGCMSDRELMFVIGHEFGHALYNHHELPAYGILAGEKRVSAKDALKLMSWSRRAEVSADRAGLLCCQDLKAATTSFIKLSCGLTEPRLNFNVGEYLKQMSDIETIAESKKNVQDCYSSHPFNPIRVLALNYFWQSRLLADVLGHSDAKLSTEQLDEEIHKLLDFMEASNVGEDSEAAETAVIWGGLWVAFADGTVDESEQCAISEVCDGAKVAACRTELEQKSDNADRLAYAKEKFTEAANDLKEGMSNSQRCNLMQKLVVIARADQVVADEEKEVLKEACVALDVTPGFVDQILSFLE